MTRQAPSLDMRLTLNLEQVRDFHHSRLRKLFNRGDDFHIELNAPSIFPWDRAV
jgi:hypothetical protein